MQNLLPSLEVFEGAPELGVSPEDLAFGEVLGLAGGEWAGALREGDLLVRDDTRLADKVAVRGEPLGDAEQDSRAVPQGELGEHGPLAVGRLSVHAGLPVVPRDSG